ncbi:MAG: hypothetical protein ACOYNZ_16435 [Rhodoferax sp.]
MRRILKRGLVAIILCSLFSAAAYYFLNVYAFFFSLPMFGIALSRVTIDLLGDLRHRADSLAMAQMQGRHYSYAGIPLHVLEDEEHCRWIPTAVVREIVGGGTSDRALAISYAGGWCAMGKPEQGHLRDDALMIYLTRHSSVRGLKFRHWAERNIAFPARRQRQRLGIHPVKLGSDGGEDTR